MNVLAAMGLVIVAVLAAALAGLLDDRGAVLLVGVGGILMTVFCRSIAAWITDANARLRTPLTLLGRPVVIALAGGFLAISGLYGFFTGR